MSLEVAVCLLAIVMVSIGTLAGWLLCARFGGRSFRDDCDRHYADAASGRQRIACSSGDGNAHGDRRRESCRELTATESYATASVNTSLSQMLNTNVQIRNQIAAAKPVRQDSVPAASVRDPIGSELAVPCVRNTFSLALGHHLADSARRGDPLCVILIRIDDYQGLCDRFGLQSSNQLLDAAGRLFISSVRKSDWVARFDVATFAFLLPNTIHENSLRVAERLRSNISSAKLSVDGTPVPLALSVGTTEVMPGDNGETILCRAEEAMNASIRIGGNRVHSHADGCREIANAS